MVYRRYREGLGLFTDWGGKFMDLENSTNGIAGFDYDLREFQNAIETLLNVFYLLELEANNPERVRRYLRLTDPAMESLLKILKARLKSA